MNDHSEMQELLPWFVNGSLNEAEQSRVDAHLGECPECKLAVEQLVTVSAEFNLSTDIPDDLVDAGRRGLDRFMEGLPPRRDSVRTRRVRSAVAVCGVAVIAIAIAFAIPGGDTFRTLSKVLPASETRPVVQVVFSPEATEKTIRELLLQDGNEVLSGPTRQGVYRVALGEGQRSDIFVARLERNPDVIFVEAEKSP